MKIDHFYKCPAMNLSAYERKIIPLKYSYFHSLFGSNDVTMILKGLSKIVNFKDKIDCIYVSRKNTKYFIRTQI